MTSVGLMNAANIDDLRIRGELILDATGNPWPTDFIAFHWIRDDDDGLMFTMTRQDSTIDEALSVGWRYPQEGTYPPLVR